MFIQAQGIMIMDENQSLKLRNCSACHFDERQRGEIQRNIEKDFSWRLAPLEMTRQGSELAE